MTAPEPRTRVLDTRPELFDLPAEVLYLNTAGAGPRLHSVSKAGAQALRDNAMPWRGAALRWREQGEALRDLAAEVLGTEADALAFTPSVSYGMAVAARNLPLAAGQNAVVLAREYPSNRAAWQAQAHAAGAAIRCAEPAADETWTAAVLRCIDDRTAVVCVPHCHWIDGAVLDLPVIARAAEAVRAGLVIDASQSLGVLPLDFAAIAPDFVICPGHKWLLGAFGLGWLWAAPHWREQGEPIEQTLLAREASGDFATLGERLPPFRAGARRFDFGPYPHPISVPMATAALAQIRDWGVAAISEHLAMLTSYLQGLLEKRGLGDWLVRGHAPHLCALLPPPDALPVIVDALEQSRVVLMVRAGGLRIAPHLHVQAAQLDQVVEVLATTV